MISGMSDRTNQGKIDDGDAFTISCDACVMQATSACGDCVVTFLLDELPAHERAPTGVPVDLDSEQARVIQLFGKAGMVPRLRHVAS
jgi:hypothetical protein